MLNYARTKTRSVCAARWTNSSRRSTLPIWHPLDRADRVHQIFSDESSPYGPISFLPILWKAAGGSSALSEGYAQHDAHEIFLACLSQIHSDSKGSTNVSCNCVIHSTFSGRLSSEVKCGKASCGHLSTKVDPMFDISLELRGKGGKDDGSENTLTACLRKCG
jgi:ubiquitin carboxyl-terminal hydrolase 22/27/51